MLCLIACEFWLSSSSFHHADRIRFPRQLGIRRNRPDDLPKPRKPAIRASRSNQAQPPTIHEGRKRTRLILAITYLTSSRISNAADMSAKCKLENNADWN